MKIFRLILTILFIPICGVITISFYEGVISIKSISEAGFYFILGALLYAVIHILLFRLDFIYVLGHEAMHILSTLFSGGKVKNVKVESKEGSVKTTTPNFFVMLAPYLIPLYTLIVSIIYFILSFWVDTSKYSHIFFSLIGFTLMFHLAYTAESVRQKQSDLIKSGYLLSIFLIYIINLSMVFLIISLLFSEASFSDFIISVFKKTAFFYYSFWKQLFL